MKNKFYPLLVLATIILLVIEFFLSDENKYFTRIIIMPGTLILALICLISFLIFSKSLKSDNPYRFVGGVMSGTFIKLFLCVAATVLLLFVTHKKLHKPDLFFLMFVYVVYTFIETAVLKVVSRKL